MTQIYEVSKNLQILLSFCLARWHLAIATTNFIINNTILSNNPKLNLELQTPYSVLFKYIYIYIYIYNS